MVEGSLSQDEIDQLLQGADDFGGSGSASGAGGGLTNTNGEITPVDSNQLASVISHAMQSGIPGLGSAIGKNVVLSDPFTEVKSFVELQKEYSQNFAIITQDLSGVLTGKSALIISGLDAAKLSSLIMGGEGVVEEPVSLDSAQLATVKDALSPVIYSGFTQLSVKIGAAIDASASDISLTAPRVPFPIQEESLYLRISFPIKIEGVLDTRIHFLLPTSAAKEILKKIRSGSGTDSSELSDEGIPAGGVMNMSMSGEPETPSTGIQGVQFPQLNVSNLGAQSPNMNLLMDVQMNLTVELGRTKMYIKEILSLGEGSIIELDKLAGEPVDLLVNGKLIAKGEVVVIDENFGVRVTDIVSPIERLKSQKSEV